MNKPLDPAATVTRAEVEDFLFHEADLLDNWRLDDWLGLLTDDAEYYVPPNDKPGVSPSMTSVEIPEGPSPPVRTMTT